MHVKIVTILYYYFYYRGCLQLSLVCVIHNVDRYWQNNRSCIIVNSEIYCLIIFCSPTDFKKILLLQTQICVHHISSPFRLRKVVYVVMFVTYRWKVPVWISVAALCIPAEDLCGFSEPVQENEGNRSKFPWPLYSTYTPTYYSLSFCVT